MTNSINVKRPSSLRYIIIVVLGALLLGMGTNLILVYTGAVTGDSFKTTANVVSCEQDCTITYDRAGQEVTATLRGTSGDFEPGAQVVATVYENDETTAYPERVVPLGFALTVGVVGLMVTVYGAIRLLQAWKRQVKEQQEVIDLDESRDDSNTKGSEQ